MQKKYILQNNRIRPLTIKTCLYPDESLSSWLIRAALNQGCDVLTFTQFYWPSFRLWNYDVDRGFQYVNEQVHRDIAILANNQHINLEAQTLISFGESLELSNNYKKISIPWTQPLSKRSRRSLLGYQYCPLCMRANEEARLKISWRFTWSVYCEEHRIPLQSSCNQCGHPYQPQLLEANLRYINHCHHCKANISSYNNELVPLVNEDAYKFQNLANKVCMDGFSYVFGTKVSIKDWFDLMAFYINIVRRGAINPSYMFGKLVKSFGIDIDNIDPPNTGLRLSHLPVHERIDLLGCAIKMDSIDSDEWLERCAELKIKQNSFNWSKQTVVPKSFHIIYEKLSRTHSYRARSFGSAYPKSPDAVMKRWERVKRKNEMKKFYDEARMNYEK